MASHEADSSAQNGAQKGRTATLRVFRGDVDGGQLETYPGMVVLDAIHDIQAKQEPSLAVRWNCKAGRCGSCSAEVNIAVRKTPTGMEVHEVAHPAPPPEIQAILDEKA